MLALVGVGLTLGSHLTPEGRGHIETADAVLLLVRDPLVEAYLRELNPAARRFRLYREPEGGAATASNWSAQVQRRAKQIVARVRRGDHVCVVLDGHPAVMVPPAHMLVQAVRAEGLTAVFVPGISAEDCLFADLGVDPAADGCQSFEATDFLIRRRAISTTSALILRQVGLIGELMMMGRRNTRGLRVLREVLQQEYGGDHEVVVYEAAPYNIAAPLIERTTIRTLEQATIGDSSTLFVPPLTRSPVDRSMLRRLRIPLSRVRE